MPLMTASSARSEEHAMPKALFEDIYLSIREKIKDGTYPYQSFIPSESELIGVYSCSRNTVRRALAILADEGFVQPIHGKGVRVIWYPDYRDVIGSFDGLYPSRSMRRTTT